MPKKQQTVYVASTPPEGYKISNPIVLALIIEGLKRLQEQNAG